MELASPLQPLTGDLKEGERERESKRARVI